MDFACSVKKRILRLSEWSFKCWQQHRKYCAHTHTHTHTYTPTRNMHSCMHVHMHAHTHLHACRHSRAHKHTHTHWLTYVQIFTPFCLGVVRFGRGRRQTRCYWGVTATQAPQPLSPPSVPTPTSTSTLTAASATGGSTSPTPLSLVGGTFLVIYLLFFFHSGWARRCISPETSPPFLLLSWLWL